MEEIGSQSGHTDILLAYFKRCLYLKFVFQSKTLLQQNQSSASETEDVSK
jgi:hypothetical protein